MTDAITNALNDLDAAISQIDGELSTLVTQIGVLQQQIAAGNTTDAATLAAEIEQRATTLQSATAAAQAALNTAGSPTSGGTTNPPPSTPVGDQLPPVPEPATDTPAQSSAPGSPMG